MTYFIFIAIHDCPLTVRAGAFHASLRLRREPLHPRLLHAR
jgi:hypothetical protein